MESMDDVVILQVEDSPVLQEDTSGSSAIFGSIVDSQQSEAPMTTDDICDRPILRDRLYSHGKLRRPLSCPPGSNVDALEGIQILPSPETIQESQSHLPGQDLTSPSDETSQSNQETANTKDSNGYLSVPTTGDQNTSSQLERRSSSLHSHWSVRSAMETIERIFTPKNGWTPQKFKNPEVTIHTPPTHRASVNRGNGLQKCLDFSPTSTKGAVFNLMVAILGVGILSFPMAFQGMGLLWAIVLLLFCTSCSYVSLKLLILASDALKKQSVPGVDIMPSYPTLSMQVGGRPLTIFTQIMVLLSLWGSANSRILGAGKTINSLYASLFKNDADNSDVQWQAIVIFTTLIVFPLGLMRDMSSLRFTSTLSVICSMFLTSCLLYEYLSTCGERGSCLWELNQDAMSTIVTKKLTFEGVFTAFPLFIFGYNCHPSVFPIYKSLVKDAGFAGTPRSPHKMGIVFKVALALSMTAYMIAASSGFLLLLDDTPDSILDHDFAGKPHMQVAKVLFAVAMILAVPTFVNCIRSTTMDMVDLFQRDMESEDELAEIEESLKTNTALSARGLTPRQISRQRSAAKMRDNALSNTPVATLTSPVKSARHRPTVRRVRSKGKEMRRFMKVNSPSVSELSRCRSDSVDSELFQQDIEMGHVQSHDPLRTINSQEEITNTSSDDEDEMSWKELTIHILFSVFICCVLAIPACVVKEISVIFRFCGATSNPITGYILPTVFVVSLVPSHQQKPMKIVAVLMSIIIGAMSCVSFAKIIMDVI